MSASRPLEIGEFAPWVVAPTPNHPAFNFSTLAGRYVLLGFPKSATDRDQALAAFAAHRPLFDDLTLTLFLVAGDASTAAQAQNQTPGLRWFLDPSQTVTEAFAAPADQPLWLLLDPMLRVMAREADVAAIFRQVSALPAIADYADTPLTAPVLIVPRVFEPDICRRLIEAYQAHGGAPSGVMRDVDGKTVGVLDGFKRRRDVTIEDPGFRQELLVRLRLRLLPQIARAFQFSATRLERYIVACYDSADGGFFRPHRDNETYGTAHRRFAVSINLNAEAFTGGDLRFPEFGPRTYRPPTGGAVVFCCSLQHEATPVTGGIRYAFLPFLYDEAGARVREANLARAQGEATE